MHELSSAPPQLFGCTCTCVPHHTPYLSWKRSQVSAQHSPGASSLVTGDTNRLIRRAAACLGASNASGEWLGQLGCSVRWQPHVPFHPGHQCAAPADGGGCQHCTCGSQCTVSPGQPHFWHQLGESHASCCPNFSIAAV